MEAIGSPTATTLLLSTGESLEVAGTPDDVGRLLQDAVRSSSGTLAWLQAAGADETVGVNPAHVVTVTGGSRSRRT
jgi:hypothetical protein